MTCRSSLFVDRNAVVFPRRWFHFAVFAVFDVPFSLFILFYFIVSFSVLELCSIRLKSIRFYCERLSRNFLAAFDYRLLVLRHSLLRFACVIIVSFDCEFAGCKFVGMYVYVNGLDYRFLAAAIF